MDYSRHMFYTARMTELENHIRTQLFSLQDLKYRAFNASLLPTVSPETIIGVRTPLVRKLAKAIARRDDVDSFLQCLPHAYYEENNLHGFLLETMRDYDRCIAATEAFLPYIDNWATCDAIHPPCFGKHKPELLQKIKGWLVSPHPYTVRFGIGQLLRWFLDDDFSPDHLEWVSAIRRDEYYVNMMIAWYVATALAKQYDATIPLIEQHTLDAWTHNKAIQKARESFRVSAEHKAYLKTLKV